MWLILFTLGLGVLIAIAVAGSFHWPTLFASLLFALVFLVGIHKDSRSPQTPLGWTVATTGLGLVLFQIVKKESSFVFGVLFVSALFLAVYSAWKLYLRSDGNNADGM